MTMPNQPGDMYGQPAHGVPMQGIPPYGGQPYGGQPYGGHPPQGPSYGYQGPPQRYGAYPADPQAPFGRDPATGQPLSDKSAVAAGLLQLLLGGFGVGRFYLGYTAIGAIQLGLTIVGVVTSILFVGLFFLAGVGIWALVDAVMMFTRSLPDQYGRKLRS